MVGGWTKIFRIGFKRKGVQLPWLMVWWEWLAPDGDVIDARCIYSSYDLEQRLRQRSSRDE